MSRHVFGPVPSRRLGFSLGVDPVPRKYCNFDCVYCQVGKTTHTESERKRFFDPEGIVREVLQHVQEDRPIDVITISGSGEPTLNLDLGWMLRELRRKTQKPLAVITNGSLLAREDVCEELTVADIVLPSLDAVNPETFKLLNRPHPTITVDHVITGLQTFRRIYRGKIWLEIMLVKGLNERSEELEGLNRVLRHISLEKIQLNTITRPAPDQKAEPLDAARLSEICRLLGNRCEIIAGFDKRSEAMGIDDWVATVLNTVERRALTIDDIVGVTGVPIAEAAERLKRLVEQELLTTVQRGDMLFYTSPVHENLLTK
jgi:wyosine [tRNA(Phe)-imidazoG37] synthetase (radical SAM superfamily)